jgi:hypothetical protein
MSRSVQMLAGAFVAIAVLLLGVTWCEAEQMGAAADQTDDAALRLKAQPGSLDMEFVALNLAIPSFSGMHWEEGNVLKVMLQSMADADSARPKVLEFLERTRATARHQAPRIVFEKARTTYTWFQIESFKGALRDVFVVPDVVLLDANEVQGLVTIGISNDRARAAVEDFVRRSGVPADAVKIELTAPIAPLQSLTDDFRPMMGGIQIKNDAGPFHPIGISTICTLTVVARRLGATGFVTNSHCTRIQGGVEATSFFQNGRPFAGLWNWDYVAHESADPPWTSMPGCPTGMLCRRSDSAFAVIDIGNQNGLMGFVARPSALCLGLTPCTLNMPTGTSTIALTALAGPPLVGAIVTKIGRTTGWTGGPVVSTCADTRVAMSTFVVLCQTTVTGVVDSGDSGSPVVVATGSATPPTTGTLAGILWGGFATTPGVPGSFTFSPIAAVESELAVQLLPAAPTSEPPPSACVSKCQRGRTECLEGVAEPDPKRTSNQCATLYGNCVQRCRTNPDGEE